MREVIYQPTCPFFSHVFYSVSAMGKAVPRKRTHASQIHKFPLHPCSSHNLYLLTVQDKKQSLPELPPQHKVVLKGTVELSPVIW